MHKLFLLVAICLSSFAFAQTPNTTANKTVIGYCNFDSLINLMPGYRSAADSIKLSDGQLGVMQTELALKQNEFDSLNTKWSAMIIAIKQKEIDDLKSHIEEFKHAVKTTYAENTKRSELKFNDAIQKIATAKGYSAVLDSEISDTFVMWSSAETHFVNITKEVCAQLGIK